MATLIRAADSTLGSLLDRDYIGVVTHATESVAAVLYLPLVSTSARFIGSYIDELVHWVGGDSSWTTGITKAFEVALNADKLRTTSETTRRYFVFVGDDAPADGDDFLATISEKRQPNDHFILIGLGTDYFVSSDAAATIS